MNEKSGKVLSDTLGKLLSTKTQQPVYLIGVFGWITQVHHDEAVRQISGSVNGRNFLTISFIGADPEKEIDWTVQGTIWYGGKRYYRKAKAEPDKGGYWYIYFPEGSMWEELTCEVSC